MTAHHFDRLVEAIALRQSGAFSRNQALERHGSDKMIRRRLACGQWRRAATGVYALSSAPPVPVQALWVAVLAAGRNATVSHEAAAARHGVRGYPVGKRVVTVPHSGYARLKGVTVHQISDLTAEWRTQIDGLPVTTVARTFVDLAAVSRRLRLRTALDDARAANKVSLDQVGVALAAVARQGKPGVRLLGAVLDELGPGVIVPATVLEQRLHAVVEHAGLPPLVAQYGLPGRQLVKGCVDGAWPDAQLLLEADSRRWHTRIQDLSRDNLRDQEAARAGWQVLRVMWEHLVSDPVGTADMLRATRAMRLRQVA